MVKRVNGLSEHADMLYRAAAECCRQHRRYASLVERESDDAEQKSSLEMACLCDDVLEKSVTGYEKAAGRGGAHADEAWWHRANMLWHASGEYLRHHATADRMARRIGVHSKDVLGEMAVEFDLEASSLLALRMAVDAYREVRPEAG